MNEPDDANRFPLGVAYMTTHLHDVLIRKAFWTAIFIVVLAGVPALAADARQPDEGLATSDARSTDVDHDGHDGDVGGIDEAV